MSSVRVRFAPSPTGSTHIGLARTALYNWLYARQTGGKFVLRIEDTDKARNTEEALVEILEVFRWLGIDWDEGPEVGGEHGPYFQSQRGDIYKDYLAKLDAAGRLYEKDGATFFKLEGERYTEYDEYHKAKVEKVRTKPVVIHDLIRGDVTRREERDFVLVRSNGDPSFHFVNVVDDIAMKITHVIRGEDHLSNTSKHIELFNAFGVEPPTFAHLPMILKDPSMGKGKMSKRDRGALITEYQERNFLPEAVRNFIALLGWSPKDDSEVLPIEEIIQRFAFKDVQKAGARFDEKKMSHINFERLKALPIETYVEKAKNALSAAGIDTSSVDPSYLQASLQLCQEKIDSLENLPSFAAFFYSDDFPNNEKSGKQISKKGNPRPRAQEARDALSAIDEADWTAANLDAAFQSLAETHDCKPFVWYPIIRFATSGTTSGPDFLPMLEVLGKDRVTSRLEGFINHG